MEAKEPVILFEETQQMRHWMVWALMLGSLALIGSQAVYLFTQPKSDASEAVVLIAILLIYMVPATLLMLYAKLIVKIDANGITYGWNVPTKDLNRLARTNIAACEIITHRVIGYGYKLTKKHGIVYTTAGRQGLQITTHSGEKILLGTQKPAQMQETLNLLGF